MRQRRKQRDFDHKYITETTHIVMMMLMAYHSRDDVHPSHTSLYYMCSMCAFSHKNNVRALSLFSGGGV